MKQERWQWGLSALLYVILISLILLTKKPECIDSMYVERIDRVAPESKESIFHCSARVSIPLSEYFTANKKQLEGRIDRISNYLSSMDRFRGPMQITIDEAKPIEFSITKNKIHIGSTLLNSEGHLERAIIKYWLADKVSSKFDGGLFAEVIADFILSTYQGSLNLEDPLLHVKTQLSNVKWPQVLKLQSGYCDSPWKLSEHYTECESMQAGESLSSRDVLNLSLRPLLSSVWIKTFSELSFKARGEFLQHLPEYLRTQRMTSEKAIEMILSDTHPIKQGMLNIKKMTDMIHSSKMVQSRREYREFYSRLAGNLQQAGVSDSFAEAYFDFLVEYPELIDPTSEFFKSLVIAAEKNPQYQIAVKDDHQIWILPSKYSLPLKTFDEIKSQQTIFFACLSLKDININRFFDSAEKLLLIKGCNQKRATDFNALVAGGAQSFSRANKNLAFIQFHLPSFEMKAKELSHVKNFFDLVKNRDVTKTEFQTLGWRQIQWSEDFQAYKPNAVIDAIELFRDDIN